MPLAQLVMNRNHVEAKSYFTLATFVGAFRSLHQLSMSHCGLSDYACVILCEQLKLLSNLRELDLTQNNLTDDAIENGLSVLFVPELQLPLESLILARNQAT